MLAIKCQSGGPTVCSGGGMVIDMPCCDVSHSVQVMDLQFVWKWYGDRYAML